MIHRPEPRFLVPDKVFQGKSFGEEILGVGMTVVRLNIFYLKFGRTRILSLSVDFGRS